MKNVNLEINGKKLEVQYHQMEVITHMLGNEKYFAPMLKMILGLNIPALTKLLGNNQNVSVEELDALWQTALPALAWSCRAI